MEDEQLRKIAQLLVNNAIEKAVDQVKTENKEMDEGLDQGVDAIVGLTIGRSVTAIRGGQRSPTDDKMKVFDEQLDEEINDIVGLTIGRSITAIREGQNSPTDNKVEGSLGFNKNVVTATQELASGTTGSNPLEIKDERIEPSVEGNDNHPRIITSNPVKDDKSTELKKGHVTATHAQRSKASQKPNVLKRLLNSVLKRDKKEAKASDATTDGGSTNTSIGGKKKSSPKAHNKRDWIRRNILCCFVRQTATVEPILD